MSPEPTQLSVKLNRYDYILSSDQFKALAEEFFGSVREMSVSDHYDDDEVMVQFQSDRDSQTDGVQNKVDFLATVAVYERPLA